MALSLSQNKNFVACLLPISGFTRAKASKNVTICLQYSKYVLKLNRYTTYHNIYVLVAGLDAWLGLTDDPINKQVQRVPHLHIARLDVRPIDRGLNVALDPAPVPLHRLDGLVEIVVVVRRRVQQDRLEVDGSPSHLEAVLWNRIQSDPELFSGSGYIVPDLARVKEQIN